MWDTITHPQHKAKVMFYYEVLNSLDYKGSMTSLQSSQSGFSTISKASNQHSTSGVSSCISGNLSETTTRNGEQESWHGMGLIKKRFLPPPVSLVHIDNTLSMPWQYSSCVLVQEETAILLITYASLTTFCSIYSHTLYSLILNSGNQYKQN